MLIASIWLQIVSFSAPPAIERFDMRNQGQWFDGPIGRYQTRFIRQEQASEIINLYHLANCALSGQDAGRWARMNYAAKQFSKLHPEVSVTAAYKDLDGLLA